MIKAVLFDYGGVLSKGGQSVRHDIAQVLGISDSELNFEDVHEQFRRGKISSAEFFGTLEKRHGSVGKLEKGLLDRPEFAEKQIKIYSLAQQLRSRGIKIAVFSNIYQPSADLLRSRGLYDGFDTVILSCEEGYAKPDTEFYQIALKRLGVSGSETLLIDDQDKCLEGAKELGIKTIKALTPEQVVRDVSELMKVENQINI